MAKQTLKIGSPLNIYSPLEGESAGYARRRGVNRVALLTILGLSLLTVFAAPILAAPETITTPEILADTVKELAAPPGDLTGCFHRQETPLLGSCVWFITPPPRTVVFPRVGHYIPEFIVSVMPDFKDSAWTGPEIESILATIGAVLAGQNPSNQYIKKGSHVKFREVIVLAHPLGAAFKQKDDLFCTPQAAVPLFPHFTSAADFLQWRSGDVDRASMLNPFAFDAFANFTHVFLRSLGVPLLDPIGGIYPRFGFTGTGQEADATRLVAFRAMDIVTRPLVNPPVSLVPAHLAIPTFGLPCGPFGCENRVKPKPAHEVDVFLPPGAPIQLATVTEKLSNHWQVHVPRGGGDVCENLGSQRTLLNKWKPPHRHLVATIWRWYTCCTQKRGEFVLTEIVSEKPVPIP